MASYNFLKQATVFIVDSSNQKRELNVSSVNFSQTFAETSYSVKTLHSQNMFEGSSISKANPANFDLSVNMLQQPDSRIIFDRLLDHNSFDLYIKTEESVFKLQTSVITNGSFILEKNAPLVLEVSGEAQKLTRVGAADSYVVPGTLVPKSSFPKYNQLLHTSTFLGGLDISSEVVSLSIELQNEVNWTPYTTIQQGVAVEDKLNTMYPRDYTVSKRILAGNITRFLTDENAPEVQSWSTDTTLNIQAGEISFGTLIQGFEFDIANCSYTNRASVGSVFTESYDWRMTQNPTSMSDVITYITT